MGAGCLTVERGVQFTDWFSVAASCRAGMDVLKQVWAASSRVAKPAQARQGIHRCHNESFCEPRIVIVEDACSVPGIAAVERNGTSMDSRATNFKKLEAIGSKVAEDFASRTHGRRVA